MTKGTLARRALLAVLLMVGFYLLALAIVAALLAIPYLEWRLVHRVEPQLLLFSIITSGIILWSLLPRRDRFQAPGPELKPETHPRLFDHIRDIAQRLGQRMPAEVYLIPDVNAAVSERGGMMGLGSRRVMLIGYGLLQAFTVSQVRATLAHEFGHYHHGDTKLGPWIYKTRAAIERTLVNVQTRPWLARPFARYWTAFMRLTQAAAREQEFHADQVAAQVAGARAARDVLRQLPGVAAAFDAFWHGYYAPALNSGLLPPLGEGFTHYLHVPRIAQAVGQLSQEALAARETHPYASHPSLAERLAALDGLPVDAPPTEDPRAISLLDHPEDVEHDLLRFLAGEDAVKGLRRVGWDEVGADVYAPMWENRVRQYAPALAGLTFADLPEFVRHPNRLVAHLAASANRPLAPDEAARGVVSVLGAALLLALMAQGWQVDIEPGAEIEVRRGDEALAPFEQVTELGSGELAPEAWRELCAQYGIATLGLSRVARAQAQLV